MKIVTLTDNQIQTEILSLFNNKCHRSRREEGSFKAYSLDGNDRVSILADVRDESGLLFNKINLNDIFTQPVSLSPFNKVTKQLPPLNESIKTTILDYTSSLFFAPIDDRGAVTTTFNSQEISLFEKATTLLGLGNLYLDDVFVSISENDFTIEVLPSSPYYTGTLRIKINETD